MQGLGNYQSLIWQSSNMILSNTYYVPSTVLVNDDETVKIAIDPHRAQQFKGKLVRYLPLMRFQQIPHLLLSIITVICSGLLGIVFTKYNSSVIERHFPLNKHLLSKDFFDLQTFSHFSKVIYIILTLFILYIKIKIFNKIKI